MPTERRVGFVSYATKDATTAKSLLDLLGPRLATQRDMRIELWRDREILAGERWEEQIATAMRESDFGLLFVSHAFLASEYVTEKELPALMADGRIVIPLALEPLDTRRLDLKGLALLQIFHLMPDGGPRRLSFDECGGVNRKRYCDRLVAEIVDRLRGAEGDG